MTTAEHVSESLGHDHKRWATLDGLKPLDVTEACKQASISWRSIPGQSDYRIEYFDGSAIVVREGEWDFAIPKSRWDDFCFRSDGHTHVHGQCSEQWRRDDPCTRPGWFAHNH